MSVTDFFDPSELHALQFSRSTSACSVDLRKLFLPHVASGKSEI